MSPNEARIYYVVNLAFVRVGVLWLKFLIKNIHRIHEYAKFDSVPNLDVIINNFDQGESRIIDGHIRSMKDRCRAVKEYLQAICYRYSAGELMGFVNAGLVEDDFYQFAILYIKKKVNIEYGKWYCGLEPKFMEHFRRMQDDKITISSIPLLSFIFPKNDWDELIKVFLSNYLNIEISRVQINHKPGLVEALKECIRMHCYAEAKRITSSLENCDTEKFEQVIDSFSYICDQDKARMLEINRMYNK